jgi:hypothetical protein
MTNNERCESCGKRLVPFEDKWSREWYADSECDGILTFEPDPFAIEIYDDHEPVWSCDGYRYERAMDI